MLRRNGEQAVFYGFDGAVDDGVYSVDDVVDEGLFVVSEKDGESSNVILPKEYIGSAL